MLGDHVADQQPSACGGHGGHIGTGLNLVGNDAVGAAVELLHAPDADGIGARALDVGTHGVQEVGQVHDVRLLGGIFDGGGALGQGRSHHDVHGSAHADHVQIHGSAGQAAALGHGLAQVALGDLRAHGPEALDVLVDGPDAEIAAAGHGHSSLAEAAQQRAQQVIAGPDPAHQLEGRLGGVHMAAVDLHRVSVQHPDAGPQLLQNGEQQRHVADLGDVFNAADPVHQQGGGDDGNGGIFCAADGDLAHQRTAAMNDILIQNRHPLLGSVEICP